VILILLALTLLPAPALLTLSGGNSGQGAILHAGSPQVVSSNDPAAARELLEIYGIGLAPGGAVSPIVAIGGRAVEVLYFGKSGSAGANRSMSVYQLAWHRMRPCGCD
jgi:uncharacterized protein (TIGR03437 family)